MQRCGTVLASASACALLAACGGPVASPIPASSPSASPSTSPSPLPSASIMPARAEGIDLTTLAGPTFPVQREGETGTRPIAATVLVTRADGTAVTTVHTSAAGTAQVPLPPGTYKLIAQPLSGGSVFPRPPAPTTTAVPALSYVKVQIVYDTGIR